VECLGRFWRVIDHGLLWPASNWLWVNIVNPLLTSLRQITPRKLVYLAAFIVFAYAAAEWYFSADVAMLLVGDSALYIEIVTFAYLAVARAHVHRAIAPIARRLRGPIQRSGQRIFRAARNRHPLRLPRLSDSEDTGDVPDGAFAFS